MTIQICVPILEEAKIAKQFCSTCQSDQDMLIQHFEWYGVDVTCMNCGEHWADGQRCERPFYRYWRRDSILHAKLRAIKLGLLK